jgi:hypothetical protein
MLLCSRTGEECWHASASRSVRLNRAATLGPASVLHLLDLSSTPSHKVLNRCLNQVEWICHLTMIDYSAPQPLSDSKHWESECSKDPDIP